MICAREELVRGKESCQIVRIRGDEKKGGEWRRWGQVRRVYHNDWSKAIIDTREEADFVERPIP